MSYVITVLSDGKTAHGYYTGCRGIEDIPILAPDAPGALRYWNAGAAMNDMPQAQRAFPRRRLSLEWSPL